MYINAPNLKEKVERLRNSWYL